MSIMPVRRSDASSRAPSPVATHRDEPRVLGPEGPDAVLRGPFEEPQGRERDVDADPLTAW